MKNIIIGTAGHIDHGKTTLIKALTGRQTDRLKEEIKRGISIDLGFTYFDLPSGKRAGIVDVPGHEKFIKNMLAGVSGMDIVLLVISADEGIMPQTIEHLDILSFLNINKGIIVLTKCDSVDADFLELVREDIKDRLKDSFCSDFSFVEVDSISKRGIPDLICEIDKLSDEIQERNSNSPARLNIDRVFTVKGFGTVITGTLMEGKIDIDDALTVFPRNINCKIRSIQVHGESMKTCYAGQRVAINVSNIKVDDVQRGDVLVAFNSIEESMMIDIKISLVKHSSRKLEYWDRIRLYHGTKEILGRVVILDKEFLNPGEEGYCQLRLEEKIASKKGDMFVVRFYSPMETIGGGIIIDTNPKKHKRYDKEIIKTLMLKEKGELGEIIEELVRKHSREYPDIKVISRYIGENEELIKTELIKLTQAEKIISINNLYVHINHFQSLKVKCVALLEDYHLNNSLRKGMLKEELRSKLIKELKTKDFDIFLNMLCSNEILKVKDNLVSLINFEMNLNKNQILIKNEIEKCLECDKFMPRNINEIIKENKEYENILEILIDDTLIRVSDDIVYNKIHYNKAIELMKEHMKENKSLSLGEFRDLIGASRKYAMALLDDFDKRKITKRVEDVRVLF